MEQRSISNAVIYCIVSVGLYWFYWFICLTDEAHVAVGRETTAPGIRAVIYNFFTCGLYMLFWLFRMGETLTEAQRQRGMADDGSGRNLHLILLTILVLGVVHQTLLPDSIWSTRLVVVGLQISSLAIVQRALNDILSFDAMRPIMKAQQQSQDDPFS